MNLTMQCENFMLSGKKDKSCVKEERAETLRERADLGNTAATVGIFR